TLAHFRLPLPAVRDSDHRRGAVFDFHTAIVDLSAVPPLCAAAHVLDGHRRGVYPPAADTKSVGHHAAARGAVLCLDRRRSGHDLVGPGADRLSNHGLCAERVRADAESRSHAWRASLPARPRGSDLPRTTARLGELSASAVPHRALDARGPAVPRPA